MIENITTEFLSIIKLPEENKKKLNYLMVMPDVTMFVPDVSSDSKIAFGFPLGFALVSAALKASGRNVYTLNLCWKKSPEVLLRHSIINNEIDVVLTGGYSIEYNKIKMIIETVKRIKPDIITVVGGGIISADPIVAMEALESADYGVIGEGEITVNSLAYAIESGIDPAGLDGVVCARDEDWVVGENGEVIHDLDILPYPDYDGFEYEQFIERSIYGSKALGVNYVGDMAFSRSCQFKCTFCFHTCGDKHRSMSIKNIQKMFSWFTALYPVEGIRFADELTFYNPELAIELCRSIKQFGLKYKCFVRVDMISEKMIKEMIDCGFERIWIGIESADNHILNSMRKNITIEQVNSVMKYAMKNNALIQGMLIFGDVEEDLVSFWNTMNWYQNNRKWCEAECFGRDKMKWNIRLGMIRTYPGSHIYKTTCEKGIIKDPVSFLRDGCPLLNITSMTDDEYFSLQTYISAYQTGLKLINAVVKPLSNYTVNITGCCPYCMKDMHFKAIKYVFSFAHLPCPFCGNHISMNPIEYFNFDMLQKKAKSIIKEEGAAIWAVNSHNFHFLLKSMPTLKADNVRFVNIKKVIIPENGHVVSSLEGKHIFTPDVIKRENIKIVIIPNNPKAYRQIKKQCLTEFPHVKQIVHITELI